MRLYSRAGIPEYLILNLPEDMLEYHSQPEMGEYQTTRILKRDDRFESAAVAGLSLDIETILG